MGRRIRTSQLDTGEGESPPRALTAPLLWGGPAGESGVSYFCGRRCCRQEPSHGG